MVFNHTSMVRLLGILPVHQGPLMDKTAHALVQCTIRYKVLGAVDPCSASEDIGPVLTNKHLNTPIFVLME
ncbi:MAG: hypothetical protein Kow0042_09300 [Calditrichia bacterium]